MKRVGKLVSIEGVDLTGKTTLATRIAKELGWTYVYSPTAPLNSVRREIEGLHDYPSRFFYYLSCVICAQLQLAKLLEETNVVIDRYVDSTFVMHEALGFDTSCVNRDTLPIIHPDVTIVLTANRDIREERHQLRGFEAGHDEAIEQQHEILDLAQKRFTTLEHVHVIDTSARSAEEVFQEAQNILSKELKC